MLRARTLEIRSEIQGIIPKKTDGTRINENCTDYGNRMDQSKEPHHKGGDRSDSWIERQKYTNLFKPVFIVNKNVDYHWLSRNPNPNAIPILEQNLDKVCWVWLSLNPNAIPILEQNLDKVSWNWLSGNPNAIHILEKNLYKVDWYRLSLNPNAIHILEKNLDKVSWTSLSANPNAIHILEKNLDKVSWDVLSYNPNAIHILEKNLDKVDWLFLSKNPNALHLLFSLDYKKMLENMKDFCEELVKVVFNPIRAQRMAEIYEMDMDEYLDNL